jgi:hypothetical protein
MKPSREIKVLLRCGYLSRIWTIAQSAKGLPKRKKDALKALVTNGNMEANRCSPVYRHASQAILWFRTMTCRRFSGNRYPLLALIHGINNSARCWFSQEPHSDLLLGYACTSDDKPVGYVCMYIHPSKAQFNPSQPQPSALLRLLRDHFAAYHIDTKVTG